MDLAKLNEVNKGTLMEALGIEYTVAKPGYLEATMPVDERTKQPAGLLHGGANAALAETLGSFGSILLIDREKFYVVGTEISASHIKSAKEGKVIGKATIIHQGGRMHVWKIDVFNNKEQLISSCRLTNMIVPIKKV